MSIVYKFVRPGTVLQPGGGGGSAPGAIRANEPAGMTEIGYADGTVVESGGNAFGISGFGAWGGQNGGGVGNLSIVSDAGNPSGSGQAIRFFWDSSIAESAVARTNGSFGTWDELYFSWSMFWESGGVWGTEGAKIFYFGSGSTDNWVERQGNEYMRVIPQGASAEEVIIHTAVDLVPQDQWVKMEMHIVSGAAGSAEAYLWIDEALAGQDTAATFFDASPFDLLEWFAQINSMSVDSYYRVGHFYISGRAA